MPSRITADILDILETIREDRPRALRDVLPALQELLDADRGLAVRFEGDGSHLRVAELEAHRAPAGALRRDFDALLTRSPINWAAYNPVRPEPAQRNRAVSVVEFLGWDGLRALPAHRSVLSLHGMGREDQLRVLVCDGGALLAWVGVLRAEPFAPSEVRRLQSLVPALRRRLRLERDLQTGDLATTALAASLEQLGVPAWVVSGAGAIRHANAVGRQRYDADPRGTTAKLLELARRGTQPHYEVTPLGGPGLARHFLIIERSATKDPASFVAAAANRWKLTARQTQVLHAVVAGSSNKAIAAALGCSPKAVEFHLTAIYTRSGVRGRAALAAEVFARATPHSRRPRPPKGR